MNEMVGQAQSYDNRIPNVRDIDTNRKGRWRHSPYFTQPATEVDIDMTGSRTRDFTIANESNRNHYRHGAGWTWHHVYNEHMGNALPLRCRMQLVNTALHQKTCPHVGACKQYSEKLGVKYRNSNYGEVNSCGLEKLYNSRESIFDYSNGVYQLVCSRMSDLFQIIYYNIDEYLGKDFLVKYDDDEKDTYEIMNFFSFEEGTDSIKECWQMWDWKLLEKGYFVFGTNAFGDMHIYDLLEQSYYGIYYHEEDKVYRRKLNQYYCWGANIEIRGECYEQL